jgi:MarR family transcriptional regulator for hemolysin
MPRSDLHDRDEAERILTSIRRLIRVLRIQDRQAQSRYGVTAAQMLVLRVLHDDDVGISLNELAARIETDQSSASVVVQRLVTSGLVTRTPRRDDRRHVELRLTEKGKDAIRDSALPAREKILDVIGAMSESERGQFAALMERFVDELGS